MPLQNPSDLLNGQEYLRELGITLPFTQQWLRDPTIPLPHAEIIPAHNKQSRVKVFDPDAIAAALSDIHIVAPTQQNIQLPAKLLGVDVYWEGDESDGFSSVNPKQIVSGWYGGVSVSNSYEGSASASATVDGDVNPRVKEGFSGPAPATLHVFFLPIVGSTVSDILTFLGCSPWPVIPLVSENVVVFGKTKSIEVAGAISISTVTQMTIDPYVLVAAKMTGQRKSGGLNVTSQPIPASLHGEITINHIGSKIKSATATVTRQSAESNIYDIDGNVIVPGTVTEDYTNWPDADLVAEVEVEGTVGSETLPATTPSVFPTGTYLYTSNATPFIDGWVQVTAITVEVTSDMV